MSYKYNIKVRQSGVESTVFDSVADSDPVVTKTSLARQILVTPANYKTALQNISSVNFTGSTSEYIQVNKNHVMLAVPCTFVNVEIEVMAYIVSCTAKYVLQLQSRTYTHPGDSPGNGAAYKGRFAATWAEHVKEVVHTDSPNGYAADRNDLNASYPSTIGRWATYLFRTRNLPPQNGIVPVKLEGFIDDKPVSAAVDSGGWSCSSTHFASGGSCEKLPRRQTDQYNQLLSGYRKPSEIINTPLKWILVRSDGDCVYRAKYIKVTEIA